MASDPVVELRRPWAWAPFFAADPRAWVLGAGDPAARWAILAGVLDRPDDDPDVLAARHDALADPTTNALIDRLPDWEAGQTLSGHESPAFTPNLLHLLADLGVRSGDSERVDRVVDQMLRHQDGDGRFQTNALPHGSTSPEWDALLCDTHAIVEVLVRFGHARDPRVVVGLERMATDLADTAQGRAWPCRPSPVTGFRGPGRARDFCPLVTLEALRTFARLPEPDRPAGLLDVARVSLAAWRRRGSEKPYMFGHGRTFKTVKWPQTWYRVSSLLDALGGYPDLWRGDGADQADRRALAELAACLVAYNMPDDGRVVPRSTYRGFETFTFGQKASPSPFATASLLRVLHRFDDLAAEARAVDVSALASSKGGTGVALGPRVPA